MNDKLHDTGRPIGVVMFGSGPRLTRDARLFLARLEAEPEIRLLAAICQAESQSLAAVTADLWRRRGVLALPLLVVWLADALWRRLFRSAADRELAAQMARLAGRVFFVTDIHASDVLAQVSALKPDLGLIYGSPILKPVLYEIPRLGTLGIHHGKLPDYRGNKTMFWAMYNGAQSVGVTIQKINAGLDTGEIVLDGEVPAVNRTQRSVWRDLEALGLDLYIDAILQVKAGRARFRSPAGAPGKLYRNPKPADYLRYWGRQAARRWRRRGPSLRS